MSSTSSSDSEENNDPNVLKRKKLFVGKEMYRRLKRPSVREILKQNKQGRLILRSYSQNKTLSKHSRNILIELILLN